MASSRKALRQEIMLLMIECYNLSVDPLDAAHYLSKMTIGVPTRLKEAELVALRDQLKDERDKLRAEAE